MIMRIKYKRDTTLPATIHIFNATYNPIAFHDDGVAPDVTAGDFVYTAYLTEDIPAFEAQMIDINNSIAAAGVVTTYDGHDAHMSIDDDAFDIDGWRNKAFVHLIAPTADNSACNTTLKRDYSLFITDLAVTEDPARTYNIVANSGAGSGNPTGAWTFGQLMKNMANYPITGVTTKDFLKSWLNNWLNNITVNGQTVHSRQDIRAFLIYPWIIKASPSDLATTFGGSVDIFAAYLFAHPTAWETYWNAAPRPTC